jgi:hypothetical protein
MRIGRARMTMLFSNRKPKPPASDPSADRFLEHLRTVHFTVVVTSFALLVASTIRPPQSLARAYDQAQLAAGLEQKAFSSETLDAFSKRRNVLFLVDSSHYKALEKADALEEHFVDALPALLQMPANSIQVQGKFWGNTVRTSGNFWPFVPRGLSAQNQPTLESFQETWAFYRAAKAVTLDGFDSGQPPLIFKNGKAVDQKSLGGHARHSSGHGEISIVRDAQFGLRLAKDPARTFSPPTWYVVVEITWQDDRVAPPVDEVWFPIPARKALDIDVQSSVIPAEAGPRVRGDFDDAFGDLKEVAKGLESMQLNALIGYLRGKFKDDDKKIQVFGVDIPQSALSQWGLLALLSSELYLALHLLQARRYWESQTSDFPWIALYPGVASRSVALASVIVLPICAITLLTLQGFEGSSGTAIRVMLGGAAATALILVAVIARLWPRPKSLEDATEA